MPERLAIVPSPAPSSKKKSPVSLASPCQKYQAWSNVTRSPPEPISTKSLNCMPAAVSGAGAPKICGSPPAHAPPGVVDSAALICGTVDDIQFGSGQGRSGGKPANAAAPTL